MPTLLAPRRLVRGALALGTLLATAGCAARRPAPADLASNGPGRIVTAERIARMNATTAWDVVRRSGFMISASDRQGRASRLQTRRGRSSMLLAQSDTPLVILDGVRTHDFRVLEQVPARALLYVRYLGAIEATVAQGTDAGGGLIEVRTRSDP
jgi:outer membrane cobalamin receptor